MPLPRTLLAVCLLVLAGCPKDLEGLVPDAGSAAPASFAIADYPVTLPMGYAKEAPIGLSGGGKDSFVFAKLDLAPEGLAVDFIGPGSTDDVLLLKANASVPLRLSVTGVDALKRSYWIPITLYELAAEDSERETAMVLGKAIVTLTLTEPKFDVQLSLVSTDPASLAQRWTLKNVGDDLDNLDVVTQGLFASMVSLRPELDHLALAKGEQQTFEVVPVLYPGMKSLAGGLVVRSGSNTKSVPVSFSLPAGKGVFLGFGASWLWGGDSGNHCTNESPLAKKVGAGPRKGRKKGGPETPDLWSKKGMADAFSKATGEGMAAAKGLTKFSGAKWLNGPLLALGQVFKGVAKRIAQDPPDPNFQVLAAPQLRTPPTVAPDAPTGLTQAGADALNALLANGYLIADLGKAATATLDKLGGAKIAGNAEWIDKQESLLRAYSQMLYSRTRAHAELLLAFEAAGPPDLADGITEENVILAQDDLRANGFTADELAAFGALGLDAAAIEDAKVSILAADPGSAGALSFGDMATSLYSDEDVSTPDLARVFELSAMTRASTRVTSAAVLMRFELTPDRCPIAPHTTILRLNGIEIGRLAETVPEGLYRFPVAAENVSFFGPLPSGNEIEIETLDLNTGNFVRALDARIAVESPIHGELVVAVSQTEADGLVNALLSANHAQPDLVLSTNQVPFLDRARLIDSTAVSLPLVIWNLGAAASTATQLGIYATDPRDGDPGAPLQAEIEVPAIAPGQSATVALPLTGQRLLSLEQPSFFALVKQPNDYHFSSNVVGFANEGACSAEE